MSFKSVTLRVSCQEPADCCTYVSKKGVPYQANNKLLRVSLQTQVMSCRHTALGVSFLSVTSSWLTSQTYRWHMVKWSWIWKICQWSYNLYPIIPICWTFVLHLLPFSPRVQLMGSSLVCRNGNLFSSKWSRIQMELCAFASWSISPSIFKNRSINVSKWGPNNSVSHHP